MKKLFMVLGALSLGITLTSSHILAEDSDEPTLVCEYEFDEEGNLVEVCHEVEITPLDLCTPECWGV
ncbi:MAG: hypothetical protein ACI4U3_10860 [Traorella sp.]